MNEQSGIWRGTVWLWLAVAAGAVLRLWRVHDQILGDDEYHAIHAVLSLGFPEILLTFLPSDHCIPLSALYRLWIATGQPLTEMVLRAPSLVAGIVFLIVAPRWVERRLGRPAAIAFAWLAAISPPLVFYSRIARSYMPVALLGFLAVMAFWAWWTTGRRRHAAAYALLAGSTLYFHLGTGPFLVVPFAWAAGAKLVAGWRARRRGAPAPEQPGWLAWLLTGVATAGAMAAFLLPTAWTLLPLIAEKRIHMPSTFENTIHHMLQLAAGTGQNLLAVLFWLAAAGGLAVLLVRRPALGSFSLAMVVGQIVGLLLLDPLGLPHPLIFNRYLLVTLPFVLLWTATGLVTVGSVLRSAWPVRGAALGDSEDGPLLFERSELEDRPEETPKAAPSVLTHAIIAVTVITLFAAGPLVRFWYWGGSFAHHNMFLLYSFEPPVPADSAFHEIYQRLAASPEEGAVLEFPWFWYWNTNLTFPLAQRIHRRDVVVALDLPPTRDPNTRFRNTVGVTPEALLGSRARFLLVHKDLAADEAVVPSFDWVSDAGRQLPGTIGPHLKALSLVLDHQARQAWGPPFYEDPWIAAWDLEAVRARVQ
jgi:hypothetical protein